MVAARLPGCCSAIVFVGMADGRARAWPRATPTAQAVARRREPRLGRCAAAARSCGVAVLVLGLCMPPGRSVARRRSRGPLGGRDDAASALARRATASRSPLARRAACCRSRRSATTVLGAVATAAPARRALRRRPPADGRFDRAVAGPRRRRRPGRCVSTDVGDRYPALTPDCPQAHWFEREIAEQWGVAPDGHPWLKPVRFHARPRRGSRADPAGVTDFFRVEGEEVHEVAVGPVHAGVIEPGHFRFQCHGEDVLHLEISLGYQHRGVERALVGGPDQRTLPLHGDPGRRHHHRPRHGLLPGRRGARPAAACRRGRRRCAASPSNSSASPTTSATSARWPATSASCPRPPTAGGIRGDFLNLTALLCGNRFGRGLVRPGGVGFDVDAAACRRAATTARPTIARMSRRAVDLLWDTPSVMARFEGTGRRDRCDVATSIGLVGPAARACGARARRAPRPFPTGIYRFAQSRSPPGTRATSSPAPTSAGSRSSARSLHSRAARHAARRPVRSTAAPRPRPAASSSRWSRAGAARSATWRSPDDDGRFARYKVVDPSFHNWFGLAWRCATSRSPTSRSATRASTCPTAGTTCESHDAASSSPGCQQRLPDDDVPARARRPSCPTAFRGLPVIDAATPARAGLPRPAPRPARRALIDLAQRRPSRHRPRPVPVLRRLRRRPARTGPSPSRATTGWRRAAREDLVLAGGRTAPRRGARRATAPPLRPFAEAARRSAPAAATPARPT